MLEKDSSYPKAGIWNKSEESYPKSECFDDKGNLAQIHMSIV